MDLPADPIHVAGPWTHRDVAANGARFHVVEQGEGPLVLLLHGFPTYWWTWRHQVTALARAGYRAVAMDLRGYGGSDHTPHGYDPMTLATDVTGVIRSLGESDAVVVGHGWGGLLAWSVASMHPNVVRGIVPVSMPHPRRLREAVLGDRRQRRSASYVLGYQLPLLPERRLTEGQAWRVGDLLHSWSGPADWPPRDVELMFRAAMLTPATAHCALEYHRWAIRSIPRRDGRRFVEQVSVPVTSPVLHVHGVDDPSILLSSVLGSRAQVSGPYAWRPMADCGHFPHEEQPVRFTAMLLDWLAADPAWSDPPDATSAVGPGR